MSVKSRIEDAEILWDRGRREGAWLLALVAAAATSRKRYPAAQSDNEAFKSFIRDISGTLVTGKPAHAIAHPQIVFGNLHLEDIVYKHLRCNLVHESEIGTQVAFSESKIVDGKHQAMLAVGSQNTIPDFWVLNLMRAVREAPENAAEFADANPADDLE